jgi:hypothetical protein
MISDVATRRSSTSGSQNDRDRYTDDENQSAPTDCQLPNSDSEHYHCSDSQHAVI